MAKKIRVGVLFGGQSTEHEVSLQSARSIIQNIDTEKYDVIPIGIDKQGSWFFLTREQFFLPFERDKLPAFEGKEGHLIPQGIAAKDMFFSPCVLRESLDVIFPALHGPYGEDGTVQGLVKLANLPCVGSDVLGSALCMDKVIAKKLLRDAKLPIPAFQCFKLHDTIDIPSIVKELGLPLFVKPANNGSSVGINKVHREEEVLEAIEEAFLYDEKVILEEFIEGREIECSVLGDLEPIVSLPGEIIPQHEFYSYEAKYLDEDGAHFKLPAELEAETVDSIQKLAIQAFHLLECDDMARVDFFLRKDGKLFLNELNTIPGFTTISLYPKLWEISGIPYPDLIDRLIVLALKRHKRKAALRTDVNIVSCASN
ncbi:D-alanine--D-alanine ligase family protein [Simkania sp.]|uniref:D-alanine--D-alanine ligase family protein n=1 Tax=Simkania sp. TaxID=34094 RepID=UPI003B51B5E8